MLSSLPVYRTQDYLGDNIFGAGGPLRLPHVLNCVWSEPGTVPLPELTVSVEQQVTQDLAPQ